jgi:hypothetical protein
MKACGRRRAGTRRRRSRSCLPCGCPAAPVRACAHAPAGWRRRRCRRRSRRSRPAPGRARRWPAPAGRRPPPGCGPCSRSSALPCCACRSLCASNAGAGSAARTTLGAAASRGPRPRRPAARASAWRCGAAAAHAPGPGPTGRPETAPGRSPAAAAPWLAMAIADHVARHAAARTQAVARAVLDGIGQQFVERQRDRDRLGLGQQASGRPASDVTTWTAAAEGALHRRRDGLEHMRHAQRPATPTCRP